LEKVLLPNGLFSIERNSFLNCTSLTDLYWYNDSTPISCNHDAFKNCAQNGKLYVTKGYSDKYGIKTGAAVVGTDWGGLTGWTYVVMQ
jgi:hypothetical protein